jgi:hypothetical protein
MSLGGAGFAADFLGIVGMDVFRQHVGQTKGGPRAGNGGGLPILASSLSTSSFEGTNQDRRKGSGFTVTVRTDSDLLIHYERHRMLVFECLKALLSR